MSDTAKLIEEVKRILKANELPGCSVCPHVVGEHYNRSCEWPDCLNETIETLYPKGRCLEVGLAKAIAALEQADLAHKRMRCTMAKNAKLMLKNEKMREALRTGKAMGFFVAHVESGSTHRDLCKLVEDLLEQGQ